MRCADDAVLWEYVEGGLPPDTRAALETHLATCESCRQALTGIGATRTVLRGAAGSHPQVKWDEVDDAVMGAATVRFAQANRSTPGWALAGLAAAAALAFAFWAGGGETVAVRPSAAEVHVESAEDARVTEGTGEARPLERGLALHEGARIQTDEHGSAFVRLPEASRARLGPRTDAVLARAGAEAVDIRLHRGAVVVEASHAARERFVIEAPEASVRVVGTVFRVSRREGQVAIAVSEGRVLVEPRGGGQSRLVDAGQRLVLGPRGVVLEAAALAAEDQAAFAQLAPPPHHPEEPIRPEEPTPEPGPARRASPRPEVSPVRTPTVIASEPRPPSAAPPPGIPMAELVTPDFGTSPAEEAAQAVKLPERATKGGLPTTAEALFLKRAEDALRAGGCGSYLLGLGDITETSEDKGARETARILRARCFDDRLEPVKADAEYRKYLDRYPAGRFADEALSALSR